MLGLCIFQKSVRDLKTRGRLENPQRLLNGKAKIIMSQIDSSLYADLDAFHDVNTCCSSEQKRNRFDTISF